MTLGQQAERFLVERDRVVLRPAAAGVFGGGEQIANRALTFAGFTPVVRDRLTGRRRDRRFLEEARDDVVPLPPCGAGEPLVRDVPDEPVLEAELVLALQARDRLAANQVAPLERAEKSTRVALRLDRLQGAVPEGPADDRRVEEQRPLRGGKRVEPRGDDAADAGRELAGVGVLGQRRRELLDEERVALRDLQHARDAAVLSAPEEGRCQVPGI